MCLSKSVIVKSVERNAGNMYDVRGILLGLESSCIASAISNVAVNGHNPASPPLIGSVGLDTLASAGLRLSTLGNGVRSVPSVCSACVCVCATDVVDKVLFSTKYLFYLNIY